MNKKFRKLILPVSLLATSQVYALGLGDLQVNSALDEVLNGQIPIIVDTEEDIANIKVTLASNSDYQRVGLDKSYVPTNIQIDIIDENNSKHIEVSSKGPVSEPIVSLLISVNWANGHLLREYTILLDPPLFNTSQTQQNFSDPVQTQTYTAQAKIESGTETQTQSQTIPQSDSSQNYNNSTNNQVVVEAGDTLWKIAGTLNQGYGTQQQMMVALFNNNPSAFSRNDMNRLNKGAILNVPDADDVTMISNGEAISEVNSHLQNWSNLQTQDSSASDNSSDSSIDYGIELIPPSDSDSSNSTSGSSRDINNQNRAELSRLKEELSSSSLENDDLASRVSELEQIVEDQELALNLKDSNLAQLQQQIAENAENSLTDIVSDEPSSDSSTTDDVWDETEQDVTTIADASDDTIVEDMDTETMTEDVSSDDEEMNTAEDVVLTDSTQNEETDATVSEDNETATVTPVTTTQVTEKSLLDKLLDYKFEALIGLGGLIVAGLAFVFIRRRKADEDNSEVGGFLDSISNDKETLEDEMTEELSLEEDDYSDNLESQASVVTELDISKDEFEELLDDDLSEEEVPEVVVMDDQSDDDSNDELQDSDEIDLEVSDDVEDEISLDIEDFDIDELNLDDTDVDSELADLDFTGEETDELDIEDLSLDLDIDDLDLSDDSDDSEENEEDIQVLEKTDDEDEELDLSLDIDSEDDDFSIDTDSEDDDFSLDIDSEDDNDDDDDFSLDLDFDTDHLDIEADHSEESESADSDLSVEENIVNMDDEDDSENEISNELEFNLDDGLDDLYDSDDLNLDDDNDEADSSEYESVSMDFEESEDVDIGLDLDDIIDDDAIDTKLDLAKAYFEMGDVDGAKQMVLEIIEEGSDEQKVKAEELKNEIEG